MVDIRLVEFAFKEIFCQQIYWYASSPTKSTVMFFPCTGNFFSVLELKNKSTLKRNKLLKSSGLIKSSKKKQRLYEKFLKNRRNSEKELNYNQDKTLFESLKNKSKKNCYSDLIDSCKYNIKKTWDVMK